MVVKYFQLKTRAIDVATFIHKAVEQHWDESLLYAVVDRLIEYPKVFVIDRKGKVFISNRYRFDVIDLIPNQEWLFDWIGVPEDIQELS